MTIALVLVIVVICAWISQKIHIKKREATTPDVDVKPKYLPPAPKEKAREIYKYWYKVITKEIDEDKDTVDILLIDYLYRKYKVPSCSRYGYAAGSNNYYRASRITNKNLKEEIDFLNVATTEDPYPLEHIISSGEGEESCYCYFESYGERAWRGEKKLPRKKFNEDNFIEWTRNRESHLYTFSDDRGLELEFNTYRSDDITHNELLDEDVYVGFIFKDLVNQLRDKYLVFDHWKKEYDTYTYRNAPDAVRPSAELERILPVYKLKPEIRLEDFKEEFDKYEENKKYAICIKKRNPTQFFVEAVILPEFNREKLKYIKRHQYIYFYPGMLSYFLELIQQLTRKTLKIMGYSYDYPSNKTNESRTGFEFSGGTYEEKQKRKNESAIAYLRDFPWDD